MSEATTDKPAETEVTPVVPAEGQTTTPPAKAETTETTPKPTEAELQYEKDVMVARAMNYAEPEMPAAIAESYKKRQEAEEKAAADKAKEAEDKEKAEKEKAAKPPGEKPKPKAKKPAEKPVEPPPPPKPEVDDEALATRVAEKLAEKAPKESPRPDEGWSPKQKRHLEVVEAMEQANPANKGLGEKVKSFWKEQAKRKEDFERQNPGEVFDPESKENEAWYNSHYPIDDDDFDEARVTLAAERIADKKVAERLKPVEEEVQRGKTQQRMAAERGEIVQVVQHAERSLVANAAPELVATLAGVTDKDTEEEKAEKLEALAVDEKFVEKFKSEDPATFKILDETAGQLKMCVNEIELLSRYGENYPDQSPPEVKRAKQFARNAVTQLAVTMEQQLAALPASDSVKDGKFFLSQQAYNARVERIVKSAKTQAEAQEQFQSLSQRYWWVTKDLIIGRLTSDLTGQARQRIQELNELHELRMKKNSTAQVTAAPKEETPKPGVTKERTKPPVTTTSSPIVDKNAKKDLTKPELIAAVSAIY